MCATESGKQYNVSDVIFIKIRLEIDDFDDPPAPLSLTHTHTGGTKQQHRALIDVHSSRTTKETGEMVAAHRIRRGEWDPSNCTMVTAERGIGKDQGGCRWRSHLEGEEGMEGGKGHCGNANLFQVI